MTAPDFTPEQSRKLAEFEAAAPAPESVRERLIDALESYVPYIRRSLRREFVGEMADAALDVLRGPATEADE